MDGGAGAASCMLLSQHAKKKKEAAKAQKPASVPRTNKAPEEASHPDPGTSKAPKKSSTFGIFSIGSSSRTKEGATEKKTTTKAPIPTPYDGPAPAPQPVTSPIQATQRDQAFSLPKDDSPLCIFPDQIALTQQTLTYKCSNWSRRHPVILNILGEPVLNVRSKTFTMTRERELRNDTDNQVLMTIHRHIWTGGPPYYTFLSPSGMELLRLDHHWQFSTSRMVASFTKTLSQLQSRSYITMDGNFASTIGTVRDASNDVLLAEFRRHLAKWKQTYTVTIQPGTDIALVIGLLVCFDDREGHDFPVSSFKERQEARHKDREHEKEKRRQIQLPRDMAAPGNLDGAISDVVKEKRKALARRLHRREKRFRGAGYHLGRGGNWLLREKA